MSGSSRLWQGGAATRRPERLRRTSGPECKRTRRPWCGRPSILWGKPKALSTTGLARASCISRPTRRPAFAASSGCSREQLFITLPPAWTCRW